jgi:hypothetical protein
MKGLEPSTFCMASARKRSRPFAPVRSNWPFAAVSVEASERTRTRANAEPCHSCHGPQTRSRLSASAASRSREPASAGAGRRNGARTGQRFIVVIVRPPQSPTVPGGSRDMLGGSVPREFALLDEEARRAPPLLGPR